MKGGLSHDARVPAATTNGEFLADRSSLVEYAGIAGVKAILEAIGEDTQREGLRETPRRYLAFLKEFCRPDQFRMTAFEAEGYDQMIIQAGIPFFSLCEHHLAPFAGTGAIAYLPAGRIVGLSKLARTLEHFSRRLQNQERITSQVADFVAEELKPKGVAVMIRARHLCMEMRGVRKHDTYTTTMILRGEFQTDDRLRREFIELARD